MYILWHNFLNVFEGPKPNEWLLSIRVIIQHRVDNFLLCIIMYIAYRIPKMIHNLSLNMKDLKPTQTFTYSLF